MGAYVECELAGDHPNNDACAFESPPCLCGAAYVGGYVRTGNRKYDPYTAGRTFKRACVVARVIHRKLAFSVGSHYPSSQLSFESFCKKRYRKLGILSSGTYIR